MYVTPNGMIFRSYKAAMDYNRKKLEKEFNNKFRDVKSVCPICGEICIKSTVKDIYICGNCNKAFSMEVENESED